MPRLTPDQRFEIRLLVRREGLTVRAAGARLGVTEATAKRWAAEFNFDDKSHAPKKAMIPSGVCEFIKSARECGVSLDLIHQTLTEQMRVKISRASVANKMPKGKKPFSDARERVAIFLFRCNGMFYAINERTRQLQSSPSSASPVEFINQVIKEADDDKALFVISGKQFYARKLKLPLDCSADKYLNGSNPRTAKHKCAGGLILEAACLLINKHHSQFNELTKGRDWQIRELNKELEAWNNRMKNSKGSINLDDVEISGADLDDWLSSPDALKF